MYIMGHSILPLVVVLASLILPRGETLELRCPGQCHCHYMSETNWRVDCEGLDWSSLPLDELLGDADVELNAANNRLNALPTFPAELRLRILHLGENQLVTIERDTFRHLATLRELDLRNNSIIQVDPSAIENNPELITLQLQGNPLALVDGPFLSSQSLLYLDLSNCNLDSLNVQFFTKLGSLKRLILTGNPIHLLSTELLAPLDNLHELYLERCRLASISPGAFARQSQLELLVLSENLLNDTQQLPWLELMSSLGALETLLLRDSALVQLPKEMFSANSNLTSLDLSMNDLSDLDVGGTLSPSMPHLTTLNLSNANLLWSLTKRAFVNTPEIQNIDLSGNWLSADDLSGALHPLHHLKQVGLSGCNLTRVPDLPPSVEMLDMSLNPLHPEVGFPYLTRLPRLETLDLRDCAMPSIPQELVGVTERLKNLQVSGNRWPCDCNVTPLAKLDPKAECVVTRDGVVAVLWTKFLRDGVPVDCRPTNEQLVQDNKLLLGMFKIFELNDTPPTWIVAVASFALLLFLSIVLVTGVVLLVKSSRRAAQRNRKRVELMASGEEEAKHQADEAELIKYLRAHRAYDAPRN